MWRMWTHNISLTNILISLGALQKHVKPLLQFLHLFLCHIRFAMTTLSKLGLCLILALHTFISLMSSPLNFYPTPRDFKQVQCWCFQSIITKKSKNPKDLKNKWKKKPWMFCCERSQQIFNKVFCCLVAIHPTQIILIGHISH